jgi:hypothetical protein
LLQGSGIVIKGIFERCQPIFCRGKFREKENNYAVSVIQQPPLNGSKVALWVYMAKGITITGNKGYVTARSNGYQHIWAVQLHEGLTSYDQPVAYFRVLKRFLKTKLFFETKLYPYLVFVHNVDINYCGVVEARKEIFSAVTWFSNALYISTGIEGRNNNPHALVIADAYSIKGLKKGQINSSGSYAFKPNL